MVRPAAHLAARGAGVPALRRQESPARAGHARPPGLGHHRERCQRPGRDLLADANRDGTVQLWDPRNGICVLTIPTHHEAGAVGWIAGSVVVGLNNARLLMIELSSAL